MLANIEFNREVDAALAFGCDGIGLYRTEYLFLRAAATSPRRITRVYRGLVRRIDGGR